MSKKLTISFIIIGIILIWAFWTINRQAIRIAKQHYDLTTITSPKAKLEVIEVSKTARITCYNDYGKMANGNMVYQGAVAVSDYSIPLNSKIYVEGYGIMDVDDHTASWVNKRGFTIDIYDPNCNLSFGVKHLTYKLLK